MPGKKDRKDELASFLRSRRERMPPDRAGFPVGHHRRTRGLRREEVALLAGVSPTWYTYLEQGRNRNVSAAVLDSLARVLELSEDERNYLHRLARAEPPEADTLESDTSSDTLVRLLVEVAEDSPNPVHGIDQYGTMIAWNRAAAEWYEDWDLLPQRERNMFRWIVTSPSARDRILDWEHDAHEVIGRWRAAIPHWRTDERLNNLIKELSDASEEFTTWWNGHDVYEHRTMIRKFRHPDHGEQAMRLIVVQAPEFAPSIAVFHSLV